MQQQQSAIETPANTDLNKERKVVNRKKKEKDRVKHYYAADNGFLVADNQLPADYENKIITGDSLLVLKKLPDNCIDLILTSPPYNFGLEYKNGSDARKGTDHFFQSSILAALGLNRRLPS